MCRCKDAISIIDGVQGHTSSAALYVEITTSNSICIHSRSTAVPQGRLLEIGKALIAGIDHGRQQLGQYPSWNAQDGVQLSVLNPCPRLLEGPGFLHHLFERHVKHDICALEYLDSAGARISYSYQTLNHRAEAIALRLRNALFVSPDEPSSTTDIVPILIPQCPELYIAILAALKVGAAFCPLDPDAPIERIKFILADVSATVVLADPLFADRFSWDGAPKVIHPGDAAFETNGHFEPFLNLPEYVH